MKLTIRMASEKSVIMECEPDMTVGELKVKLAFTYSIKEDDIELTFAGKKLEDEDKLEQCGIKNLDLIYLNEKSKQKSIVVVAPKAGTFQVLVMGTSGEKFFVFLENSDTIKTVKEKIYTKLKFDMAKYKLYWCKQELDEGKTVNQYGIKPKDLITVTLALAGGMS